MLLDTPGALGDLTEPHGLFLGLCRKYEMSRWRFSPTAQSPPSFKAKGRRDLFQNKMKKKKKEVEMKFSEL